MGYTTHADTLDLAAGEVRTLNIELQPAEVELGGTVVEAERSGGAARVTAGHQMIHPEDVELIPSPDISADLVNFLVSQPGVITTGDRGGQLFIRGGEPSQNLVFLTGYRSTSRSTSSASIRRFPPT